MMVKRRNREGAITRFIAYGLPVCFLISEFAPQLLRFYSHEIITTVVIVWLVVSATALWFDDRVFDGTRIVLI